MKYLFFLLIAVAAFIFRPRAADATVPSPHEYATLRWAGRENTCIIFGDSQVTFLAQEFQKLRKPDRVDERSFYMNAALNALSKQGYEPVHITSDEVIVRR